MGKQSNSVVTIPRYFSRVVSFLLAVALSGALVSCHEDILDKFEKALKEKKDGGPGPAQRLVTGLDGSFGSTIGPGGALYVAESAVGRISRIDPKTGDVTTFASGLPFSAVGGVYDVAFLGETAYAVVTLVGPDVGGSDSVGIYRIDGPDSSTLIADIGAFAYANPPNTDFFVPTGVQYAIQSYHGAFLVTDGHHNRVFHVTRDGEITVFKTFDNIVPTGLAVWGNTIYMAEAGPVPHLPEDGKVVTFRPNSTAVTTVASGASLLVDVEFNHGRTLFALSQGFWDGENEGDPAEPNTGALVKVNDDGTFRTITDGLDRPTSLEFIKDTAYIVTIGGEIWIIKNIQGPPFDI